MNPRQVLEELGLDVRGFYESLGVDVRTIEAAVGLSVEAMTLLLAALFALFLGFVALRFVRRRGPTLATGPSVDELEAPAAPRATDAEALRRGLTKTRSGFLTQLNNLLGRGGGLSDELVEELETVLVTADIGIRTANRLLSELQSELGKEERNEPEAIKAKLRAKVADTLGHRVEPWSFTTTPHVVMVIGVNGVGKTTTIGKLAARYAREGRKVLLAAGDTFRAAAVEQLEIWGQRAEVEVIKGEEGSDPASVMFRAVERARAVEADLLLCDTAGRLQTKVNLMNELGKIRRVIGKAMEGAPQEVLLVLDATTGQNAISQAKKFAEVVNVSALALTKLDGSAKGGVVVAIADELHLPVRFVGVGEGVDDLRDFDPEAFVDGLFGEGAMNVDAPSSGS